MKVLTAQAADPYTLINKKCSEIAPNVPVSAPGTIFWKLILGRWDDHFGGGSDCVNPTAGALAWLNIQYFTMESSRLSLEWTSAFVFCKFIFQIKEPPRGYGNSLFHEVGNDAPRKGSRGGRHQSLQKTNKECSEVGRRSSAVVTKRDGGS
jgi:hypothetical protein